MKDLSMEELKETAEHLTLVTHALVSRLGGEVTVTPEELYAASARQARWDRSGRNLGIKLGGPWSNG